MCGKSVGNIFPVVKIDKKIVEMLPCLMMIIYCWAGADYKNKLKTLYRHCAHQHLSHTHTDRVFENHVLFIFPNRLLWRGFKLSAILKLTDQFNKQGPFFKQGTILKTCATFQNVGRFFKTWETDAILRLRSKATVRLLQIQCNSSG